MNNSYAQISEAFAKPNAEIHSNEIKDTNVVILIVGGVKFSTTISTLKTIPPNLFREEEQDQLDEEQKTATDKGSILFLIASGNYPIIKDEKGRIFLDRDGTHFSYILNYLRENGDYERACIPSDNTEIVKKLSIECEYYCLNRMKYLLLSDGNCLTINNPTNWIKNSDWKWLSQKVLRRSKKIGPLLYKGSRDGFIAAKFHQLCDNKGETISIVKSNTNCVFGGYNSNSWQSQGDYVSSSTNWLFCFENNVVKQPTQLKLNRNSNQYASRNISSYLITFGGGHDLYICDNCNTDYSSYNAIGHTYHNNGIQHALNGGIQNFTVVEIEVYQIISK